ncbi:hypothetical protein B0H11DRAFT_1905063 [Mycena galericulata]|nr:hypothetical protein B0H11DRAFT_1905063 [Mycena galericulata]
MSSGETKAFVRTYVTERKIKSQGFRTQRIWIQGLSHRQGTAIPRCKGLRYKKPALYSGMPAADATKTRKYHMMSFMGNSVIQCHFFPAFNTHDSDNEEEVDGYRDHILKRADGLEQAAAILRAQVPHKNRLWMSRFVMIKRNIDIGADVGLMVDDIRKFERTGCDRGTTWAKSGNREDERRVLNTMGYQF